MEPCTKCGGRIFSKFVSEKEVEYHCINGHIIFTKIGETKPSDQDEIDSYLSDDNELLGVSRVSFIFGMGEDALRELAARDKWEYVIVTGQKRYYRAVYVRELMERYGINPQRRKQYAESSPPVNDHPLGENQLASDRSHQRK